MKGRMPQASGLFLLGIVTCIVMLSRQHECLEDARLVRLSGHFAVPSHASR